MALLLVVFVLLAREATIHTIDFPVYHRAARQILAGDYDLYPPEAYGGQPGPGQGFRYLPAIAFLFLPLGLLSLRWSAFAFLCLKLIALWWMGATIARRAGSSGWGVRSFAVAFVVAGGYLVEEMRYGNVHLLVIWLMVLAYDRAESGKVLTPALALGVAIATKISPVALLAYFALRRRVALCIATVGIVGLLVVLPAAVMGTAGNLRQLRAFQSYATEKLDEGGNYSLRGALVRHLTSGHANAHNLEASIVDLPPAVVTGLWLAGLLVLGVAALAAFRHDDGDPVARLLEFSIVLTGIVLASPHAQRRYFVALYVPVVLMLAMLPRARTKRERRLLLAGLVAIGAPATLLPPLFAGSHLALVYEAGSPYTFGALGLFAVLVALRRRRVNGVSAG